eukprot:Rhum_TRINITY_DN25421_c0_g1::Rhum_TRINITY_DN25421_c0_g1_i1::g.182006::m.182006
MIRSISAATPAVACDDALPASPKGEYPNKAALSRSLAAFLAAIGMGPTAPHRKEKLFAACLMIVLWVAVLTIFDLLRLDVMMICQGGTACSTRTIYPVLMEEYNGDHMCMWHDGVKFPIVSDTSDAASSTTAQVVTSLGGVLEAIDDDLLFTPYETSVHKPSFTFYLGKQGRAVSGVRTSGVAVTVYSRSSDFTSRIKVADIKASAAPTTTYFAPQAARYLSFEVAKGAEEFRLHAFGINCHGCEWHAPDPVTAVTMGTTVLASREQANLFSQNKAAYTKVAKGQQLRIDFDSPRQFSGISLLLAGPKFWKHVTGEPNHRFESPLLDVYAVEPDAASQTHVVRENILSPEYLRNDTQVFYFKRPVLATAVILVITTDESRRKEPVPPTDSFLLSGLLLGETCTMGRPAGVDMTLVVHFNKEWQRFYTMKGTAANIGLQIGMRDSWTRDRVLQDKDDIAKRLWPPAAKLKKGGSTREWVGTRAETWKTLAAGTMQERKCKVTNSFLGRVANFAQHFEIFQEMWDSGVQVGLVMEDDATFVKHFQSLFAKVISEAPDPDQYDMIFVGGCLNKHGDNYGGEQKFKGSWLWSIKQHRCANGYIVTRRFLEKMLFANWPRLDIFLNIDPWLESRMGTTLETVYWSEPPVIYESSKALWGSDTTSVRLSPAEN